MPTPRRSSLLAGALLAPALVAGLALTTAAPAFAKSELALRVASRDVPVGGHIRLTVDGASDDFGGTVMELCVDEKAGSAGWHNVTCRREGHYTLSLLARHVGPVSLRARLVAENVHGREVVDRVSRPVVVHVH